jgi:hypothetical protein
LLSAAPRVTTLSLHVQHDPQNTPVLREKGKKKGKKFVKGKKRKKTKKKTVFSKICWLWTPECACVLHCMHIALELNLKLPAGLESLIRLFPPQILPSPPTTHLKVSGLTAPVRSHRQCPPDNSFAMASVSRQNHFMWVLQKEPNLGFPCRRSWGMMYCRATMVYCRTLGHGVLQGNNDVLQDPGA